MTPRSGSRLLAALLGVMAGLGLAPPAGAAPSSLRTDTGTVRLALDYSRLAGRLAVVQRKLAEVRPRLVETTAKLDDNRRRLVETTAALDELREGLAGRAVATYKRRNLMITSLEAKNARELASTRHYAEAVAVVDNSELERLRALLARLTEENADLTIRWVSLREITVTLEDQQIQLIIETAPLRGRLDGLGAVPVMGDTVVPADTMARWFRASASNAHLARGATIEDLAALYVVEGRKEGVRPDVAFAQAILETGWFHDATDNNFAGIGACDSCGGEQIPFRTPQDGVRAQMQMLRAIADPDARAATLAHPPAPQVFGRDAARSARAYDSWVLLGRAPLWDVMGNGNWATSPTYAEKVLWVYGQMLAFARGGG